MSAVSIEAAVLPNDATRTLLVAAAVRERFVPDSLLEGWLADNPTADQQLLDKAIGVSLDFEAMVSPSGTGEVRSDCQLPTSLRLRILAEAGAHFVREALASAAPLTRVEHAFSELLDGRPAELPLTDRQQLSALLTAIPWALAAGNHVPFQLSDVAAAIGRIDFLMSIGGPDLHRFVGRTGTLHALRQLWALPSMRRGPVLLEGPGGIGKSLTIARFIANLFESELPEERPVAVYHFDFDRFLLQQARPATLLLEIAQQTARWWAPHEAARLANIASGLSREGLESPGAFSRSKEAYQDESSIVRELVQLLPRNNGRLTIIMLADTFEKVENFDDAAANSVGLVRDLLVEAGAEVMDIYGSRAFARPSAIGSGRFPIHIKLGRLTQKEAILFLQQEAKRIGLQLSRSTAAAAQARVPGSPLALRLAVATMTTDAHHFNETAWIESLPSSRFRIQAMLYERVLNRIEDPDVRTLAKPGLLVRRLTAPIILSVLARPCGLHIDVEGAQRLLRKAVQEGQMFDVDPSDPDAVWHRKDVRALMLEDLRAEIDPIVADAIHQAAIAFYVEEGNDARDRAEELYHRLQLGQGVELLDGRFTDAAGRRLRGALAELPQAGATWLRLRLGGSSLSEIGIEEPRPGMTALQLAEYRLLARKQLQSGQTDLSAIFESAGFEPSILTPMGDLYAESLMLRGQHQDVVVGARNLRRSGISAPRAVRAAVYACAAAALEGGNRLREAQEFWSSAVKSGRDEPPAEQLSWLIGRDRVRRKCNDTGSGVTVQRGITAELAQRAGSGLLDRRVLARELVAEFGNALGDAAGTAAFRATLLNTAKFLLDMNEAFPSAVEEPARLQLVADLLGFDRPVTSTSEVNSVAMRILHGADQRQLALVVDCLRDEVDWSLRRAVI